MESRERNMRLIKQIHVYYHISGTLRKFSDTHHFVRKLKNVIRLYTVVLHVATYSKFLII